MAASKFRGQDGSADKLF